MNAFYPVRPSPKRTTIQARQFLRPPGATVLCASTRPLRRLGVSYNRAHAFYRSNGGHDSAGMSPQPPVPGARLLDMNFVAAARDPLPQFGQIAPLAGTDHLRPFIEAPVNISQALSVDAARGAVPTLQIESMRSQKSISVSSDRVEVHDLSGKWSVEGSDLPDTVLRFLGAIGVSSLSAVGANLEMMFEAEGDDRTAGEIIGTALLAPKPQWTPGELVGAGVRVFLRPGPHTLITLAVQPLRNDPGSRTIWLAANANLETEEVPPVEALRTLLSSAYDTLSRFVDQVLELRSGSSD